MIIWDEKLSDILDDGNARRGWFIDLKREDDAAAIRLIDCANDFARAWKQFDLVCRVKNSGERLSLSPC